MIVRTLKLKLNVRQKEQLEEWLFCLTGVYNWAIKKIDRDINAAMNTLIAGAGTTLKEASNDLN